jgi:hypothetical protein
MMLEATSARRAAVKAETKLDTECLTIMPSERHTRIFSSIIAGLFLVLGAMLENGKYVGLIWVLNDRSRAEVETFANSLGLNATNIWMKISRQ